MGDYFDLRDFTRYRASAWALIAANLLPLFGVLFLGWDTFSIVALYWVENVIIGAINVLKMITCAPDLEQIAHRWTRMLPSQDADKVSEAFGKLKSEVTTGLHQRAKIFVIPFFVFHYGFFCFVHGVFIFAIFGRDDGPVFGPYGGFENVINVFSREHLWVGIVALAASHLWSFFVNYLGRGEYRRTALPILMVEPYTRVVVLHVAILIGGIVSFMLGNNALVLMILIAGKTLLDLSLHLQAHERNAVPLEQPTILPEAIPGLEDEAIATPAASEQSRPPARASWGE